MKGLILREFWLSKKSMLITFGIGIIFFTLGLLIMLSGKYGNLARYSDPEDLKDVMDNIPRYIPVMTFLLFFVGGGDAVTSTILSDHQCGWHKFIKSGGLRIRTYVGSKYLSLLIMLLVSVLAVLVIQPLFFLAGGHIDPFSIAVIAAFTAYMLLYFIYMIPLEFYVKKRETATIFSLLPMLAILILGMVAAFKFSADPGLGDRLITSLTSGSMNKWAYIGLAAVLPLMYISYELSVRIVSREG